MSAVYQYVTDRIVKELEEGKIPWRKTWVSDSGVNFPVNWESRRPYSGVNLLLLDPGEYLTFNQIEKAGGKIRKGEKGKIAVFWKLLDAKGTKKGTGEKKEPENHEDEKKIPFLRYYNVWEVSQVDGIERKADKEKKPIRKAEDIASNWNHPRIQPGDRACYFPGEDLILCPQMKQFETRADYYATLYHEMIHSTGHPSRLDRKLRRQENLNSYGREELVAEVGGSFLCAEAGILQPTLENAAAYCRSWLQTIQGDSKLIVWAAGAAQKAAEWILSGK